MIRAYHFLSADNALDNLKKKRIKISRIEDMNDPFELLPMDLSNKDERQAVQETKKDLNGECGVICFSKKWNNPVLWSHYANKHRGICLGFDIPKHFIIHIQYSEKRLIKNIRDNNGKVIIDENFIKELLSTKYKGWSYEVEVRIFAELKEQDKSGFYYKEFDENLILREVILGVRYQDVTNVTESIHKYYDDSIKLIQGRLAFKSFKIVENKLKTKNLQEKIHEMR